MAAAYKDSVDQEPSGAWVEVVLASPANFNANHSREQVLHISTDTALRWYAGPSAPAVEVVGAQVQAGGEKTLGFAAGDRLWIK